MKGFIEVHDMAEQPKGLTLVAVSEIVHVSGSTLHMKSNDFKSITCKESYERIKKLIREATK